MCKKRAIKVAGEVEERACKGGGTEDLGICRRNSFEAGTGEERLLLVLVLLLWRYCLGWISIS